MNLKKIFLSILLVTISNSFSSDLPEDAKKEFDKIFKDTISTIKNLNADDYERTVLLNYLFFSLSIADIHKDTKKWYINKLYEAAEPYSNALFNLIKSLEEGAIGFGVYDISSKYNLNLITVNRKFDIDLYKHLYFPNSKILFGPAKNKPLPDIKEIEKYSKKA